MKKPQPTLNKPPLDYASLPTEVLLELRGHYRFELGRETLEPVSCDRQAAMWRDKAAAVARELEKRGDML